MASDDLSTALCEGPVEVAAARRAAKDGGVPDEPGLYAWWLAGHDVLPDLPTSPHPTEPALRCLYVGVAPRRVDSKGTLRSRTLKDHLGSALASSTFRRSLAAMLWQDEGWTPRLTDADRWKLSPEEDAELHGWQERNLRLSWLQVTNPWDSEHVAIDELGPLLNLLDNQDAPYAEELTTKRALFTATARRLRDAERE